ncbi:MAG: hypothetical protein ACERKD_16540 [Prolixibacteraceae bacterium]
MKKIIQGFLSIILALLMFSSQAIAYTNGNALINTEEEINAVIDFDEALIYDAFDDVNELIATIEANESITYSDLETTNSELLSNVSSSAAIAMSASSGDALPFASAFWWGCLGWIPGVLLVGIITDFDNDQLTSAGWGCLITSLLGGTGLWGLIQ